MRILILSDVHANWPALQAIDEPHDLCLFLGDAVDYGLEPGPCIDWLIHHAHYGVRGNHDHGVAQCVMIEGRSGYKHLTGVTRPINRARLTPCQRRYLADLPITRYLSLANKTFLLVHATPRDPLDEYGPGEVEFWRRRLDGIQADVVCVGHTHHPFCLQVDGRLVINPGSVGLPRDGDPRGSYAVYEDGEVTLKRFDYPIEQTIARIEQSDLPSRSQQLLADAFRFGQLHQPRLLPVGSAATSVTSATNIGLGE
jgi:putative phosphoesterase